jgi:hypothetical protein
MNLLLKIKKLCLINLNKLLIYSIIKTHVINNTYISH